MTRASKARAVLRSILSPSLIPIRDQPNHTGNNVFLSSRIFCHSFSESFLHRADSSDLTITAYRDVIYDAQNGIFWVNGEPILDLTTTFSRSLLEGNRGGKLRQPNEADLPVLEEIEVNSVICPHYGHFLIESTGWLWPLFLSEDSNIPRVIATRANRNVDTEKPGNGQLAAYLKELRSAKTSLATLFYSNSYIYEFYKLLKASLPSSRPLQYLSNSCKIKKLYAPSSTSTFGSWPHSLHRKAFLSIGNYLQKGFDRSDRFDSTPKLVYLSRQSILSASGKARKIVNEDHILEILKQVDAFIVHPEILSLADQIRIINHAKVVVSTESSALHTLLFAASSTSLQHEIILCSKERSTITFQGVDWLLRETSIQSHYIPALHPIEDSGRPLNFVDQRYNEDHDHQLIQLIKEAM